VTATAALEEVKQSTKFAKILELILLIGNYMNAGSRNEQTIAFEFSFITKVGHIVLVCAAVISLCLKWVFVVFVYNGRLALRPSARHSIGLYVKEVIYRMIPLSVVQ